MTEENCCAECGATTTMPFEMAYELYRRPLIRSVRRRALAWGLTDQDVDIEALVQDTFEQALHAWHTIRVPRAWLYTVARRRLGRHADVAARRADGDPAAHTDQGAVSWTSIARAANTEDLIAAREVTRLIQLMPQQRRQEVAYLRYIEEWGFNEIAEQLGCCPATARVHTLNARGYIGDWAGDPRPRTGRPVDWGTHAAPARAASGFGCLWLVALFVLGCVLAAGFLGGWPSALAAAGSAAAVALAGWAWDARQEHRRPY
ncbi:RNA polymerase sigma factor [Streptomyces sp. NPDC059835]|uniref:RNA polymerase sigma factor n=1 Tax=Streptomyces sp. NPDC059835 TaxID=3346967 RepID=UPI0036478926